MSGDRDETRTEEVIPIVEERLRVERRETVNEIVRVKTVVHEQQQIVEAIKAGVSAYVVKPFNADQLREKLEAVHQKMLAQAAA